MAVPETVGLLLVNSKNEILLQLRDDKPDIYQPNVWGIPSGGMEKGETPEEAVLRETGEELDFRPSNLKLYRTFTFWNLVAHVFVSHINFPDTTHFSLHEGQKIQFFPKEEILKMCNEKKTTVELHEILRNFDPTNR